MLMGREGKQTSSVTVGEGASWYHLSGRPLKIFMSFDLAIPVLGIYPTEIFKYTPFKFIARALLSALFPNREKK